MDVEEPRVDPSLEAAPDVEETATESESFKLNLLKYFRIIRFLYKSQISKCQASKANEPDNEKLSF